MYVGQTAIKTRDKIREALGGVLVIDEGYSLAGSSHCGHDFGGEALTELVHSMECYRSHFAVVMIGYEKEMHQLICSNPGLERRFNAHLSFSDYSATELVDIFATAMQHNDYKIEPEICLHDTLAPMLIRRGTRNFGNAGEVRKIMQLAVEQQSLRLFSRLGIEMNPAEHHQITQDDIVRAFDDT